MNINDLFLVAQQDPNNIVNDFRELVFGSRSHGHINSGEPFEFDIAQFNWRLELKPIENDLVTVRIIVEEHEDFRRYWRLAAVWFGETPVMIVQNAGREGDDHQAKYIINKEAYKQLCTYVCEQLVKQIAAPKDNDIQMVDPQEDNVNLTVFYGKALHINKPEK